jgi:prephenate dehydrogenase
MEIGIVGFGRCGQLAARILSPHHAVTVTDLVERSAEAIALGAAWGDIQVAASRPIVLLAVPIRALPEALDAVASHLARDALVVDVASVKMRPMAWMEQRLPPGVRRVGTHPLFGPRSVREVGLGGRRIVICHAPGHEAAADEVEGQARFLGLVPIRASAEDHDREMARSQAIVFLLARSLARAGITPPAYGTPSEERLASALQLVGDDSDELYEDILRLNPFVAETADRLLAAARAEVERLGGAESDPSF